MKIEALQFFTQDIYSEKKVQEQYIYCIDLNFLVKWLNQSITDSLKTLLDRYDLQGFKQNDNEIIEAGKINRS